MHKKVDVTELIKFLNSLSEKELHILFQKIKVIKDDQLKVI